MLPSAVANAIPLLPDGMVKTQTTTMLQGNNSARTRNKCCRKQLNDLIPLKRLNSFSLESTPGWYFTQLQQEVDTAVGSAHWALTATGLALGTLGCQNVLLSPAQPGCLVHLSLSSIEAHVCQLYKMPVTLFAH